MKALALLLLPLAALAQVTAPTIPLSGGWVNTASLGPIAITGGQLSFSAWPSQMFTLATVAPTGDCLAQQIFTIVPAGSGYSLYACLNWQWTLVASPPPAFAQEYETTLGAVDGVNRTFTLRYAVAPQPSCGPQVFLGGVKQRAGSDYDISGQAVRFKSAPAAAMYVEVDYWH